jgi:hypothetical protein
MPPPCLLVAAYPSSALISRKPKAKQGKDARPLTLWELSMRSVLAPCAGPESRSAGRAPWREPVAGVSGVDEPPDQTASADRKRREHVLADLTPDLGARRGTVARCLLRETPDLRGHDFISSSPERAWSKPDDPNPLGQFAPPGVRTGSPLGGLRARVISRGHSQAARGRKGSANNGNQKRSAEESISRPDQRKCPLTSRAGEGNRTLVTSLEGWSSTTELHPPDVRFSL